MLVKIFDEKSKMLVLHIAILAMLLRFYYISALTI